eukprot:CAMPEP_0195522082 /NCGR_PEP_ID=MMETSP0794_2-20130614/20008_1 /TAXON_ID=515487 /ORGANISM="Stephanopyxis turris, Strain CCMP 815" /LENGTH=256 /DNA_ID=CAMNT_0040651765 /DNA_START=297 /DNA_END=1067 /DNA_ORIENTATION=+
MVDDDDNDASTSLSEAERLLAKARQLRESIGETIDTTPSNTDAVASTSKAIDAEEENNNGMIDYRLYLDIGREEGTWMDPTWGASGKRIEFTMDVSFASTVSQPTPLSKDDDVAKRMVKDNFGGVSSGVRNVVTAKDARLRGGFDKMKVMGGGYRIDTDPKKRGSSTVRFHVLVAGTEGSSSYGDISVPKGCLHFSIPCFGSGNHDRMMENLSKKDGWPITVRQTGWHTGWRREESRIVGVFRALPMKEAKVRDLF